MRATSEMCSLTYALEPQTLLFSCLRRLPQQGTLLTPPSPLNFYSPTSPQGQWHLLCYYTYSTWIDPATQYLPTTSPGAGHALGHEMGHGQ